MNLSESKSNSQSNLEEIKEENPQNPVPFSKKEEGNLRGSSQKKGKAGTEVNHQKKTKLNKLIQRRNRLINKVWQC